ncbi:hypothetical protein OAI36_00030 [Alphaproteobacteria bacterium]|nr:hypothetical protein [Alphaproteobacteria bacterium]
MALSGKSDLDILIFDTTFLEFNAIANTHGWIEMENPVARFDCISHYFKVNVDATIRHLHVYFEVITGDGWLKEYNFPLKDFLFMNRKSDTRSGVFVLNSTAQAYIFVIRHLIKSGSVFSRFIYARELDSYREEWSKCGVPVDHLYGVGPIAIDDWIKDSGLLQTFRQPKYSVAYNYRQFMRQYLRYKSFSLTFRRVMSLFRRASNKLVTKDKKKFTHGGIIVAISGADGAGKSTMIAGLHGLYSSFLDCKVFTLGKPQGKFLEFIRSFIRRSDKSQSTYSNPLQKQSSMMDAILASALAVLRLRKASAAVKKARGGNMVLVDRWPTNSFGKMDGPKIIDLRTGNRLISFLALVEQWIYKRIPPADICFYLVVDIDEARKRNFERVKEGKETDEMIVIRHQNNQETCPISNRLIRFSNDGSYKEMFPILSHDIWSEMVSFKQSSDR